MEDLDAPYGSHPTDAFFPETINSFRRRWYAGHLAAGGEGPLFGVDAGDREVVRFTLLRTWGKPIVVRVELAPEPRLVAKRLSGAGGYGPGTIDDLRERALYAKEVETIRAHLRDCGFDAMGKETRLGFDGAQWIVERRAGASYHIVDRWCPEPDGDDAPYHALCLALVELAGDDFVDGDID